MTDDRDLALALLRWQVEMGADEAIGDVSVNRLAAPPPPPAALPEAPRQPSAPARGAAQASQALPLEAVQESVSTARRIAQGCTSLDELREALSSFDLCPLRATATNLVFADGNPDAGLMLIGEAPGADEDRQGLPFVGASGKLLDRMLAAIGRDRTTAYITNTIFWRPPGNRTPTQLESALCMPFLERHIELVRPKVLLLVGKQAAGVVLETADAITRLRGKWKTYTKSGLDVPVMPTYHPAYLLRHAPAKREAWRDFLDVKNRLASMSGV
ncbi:uracil-DNA glycosylase [Emcibacter sp. SYSU 3D8]|uniref:uracil-DNA glycosylase n=1 Tax=Emcibacter sp. SYSU 3D8 TaxID=3133969 RepID=UPI0031FF3CFC